MIRTWIGNALMGYGRWLARMDGRELMVQLSDHSIRTKMVSPNKEDQAWDDNLYKHGNVFIEGYANPVKPTVEYNADLEDPDTVAVEESPQAAADGGEDQSPGHTEIISSPRYREFMRQDLISQLLNPRQQWKKIVYAVIALSFLMVMNLALTASAAGVF